MTTSTRNGARDRRQAAALRYIDMGFALVPLPAESKKPVIEDWPKLRITRESLDRHFPAGADGNIGVMNGTPSGNLTDADLDCDESRKAGPLLLPATGMVFGRTSAPRSHFLYKTDVALTRKAIEYKDLDGTMLVELRGNGSQTVFPPGTWRNKHEPHNTEPITWHTFSKPADVKLDELQRAVLDVAIASLLARHWPAAGWHDATLALAGALLGNGVKEERAERICEALWRIAGSNDKPSDRNGCVRTTAEKIAKDEKVQGFPTLGKLLGRDGLAVVDRLIEWLRPNSEDCEHSESMPWPDPIPLGDVPDVPPFPVEVLPDMARRLVEETAWAMNCPIDFAALPVLALAGGALANARHLGITRTHKQPPLLYGAIVSPPGAVKSPALKLLRHPYDVIQSRHLDQFRSAMDAWEQSGEDKEAKAGRGRRPVPQRCIVGDITTESLGLILCENPRGVMMVRDELAALFASMNQYKGGKGQDRQVYLSLWGCDPVLIDRKSDRSQRGAPLYVRTPFTAIIGSIQPTVLDGIRGERVRGGPPPDDGFMDRFLFAYPSSVPAIGEQWREVAQDTLDFWQDAIERLMGLTMTTDSDAEEMRPFYVGLTACGRSAWEVFTQRHADEVNDEHFPAYLHGPWSKLRGYCARLALILHYLRWIGGEVNTEDVDGESMRRAATLVNYFKAHARKVYAVMDLDAHIADARKVTHWLVKNDFKRFQKRDVHQGLRGTFKTVDELDPVLHVLVKHSLIRPEVVPQRKGPGRKPSPHYEAHPQLRAACPQIPQNTQNCPPSPPAGQPALDSEDSEYSEHRCTDSELPPEGGEDLGDGVPRPPANPPPAAPAALPGTNSDPTPTGYDAGMKDTTLNSAAAAPQRTVDTIAGYQLITTEAELATVCQAVEEAHVLVGLDTETSGLNPRTDRVRILSLNVSAAAAGDDRFTYLIDCFAVDPAPLWPLLADKDLVIHNAPFDLAFLHRMGFTEPGAVHDLLLYSRLLTAGTREGNDLKACAARELGITLDKDHQKDDWTGALTDEQLRYAALDAEVLQPLYHRLIERLHGAGMDEVVRAEERCQRALLWMAQHGAPVDRSGWLGQAEDAEKEAQELQEQLDAQAPTDAANLYAGSWNWNSTQQVQQVFALLGIKLEKADEDALATLEHPLADLVLRYRQAHKRASTYGRSWVKDHVAEDGRIYTRWNQTGAVTGRMSSSDPNLQNIPRDPVVRRCFRAPDGRVLIKADYSQIELRIAAKIADEKQMLDAYRRGDDLHTLTARRLTGRQEVTKQERQLAKPINFGLIYGLGMASLRRKAKLEYGVDLSEADAKRYRDAFFTAYPAIQRWHGQIRRANATETRTLLGRRVLVDADKFFGGKANYMVQGTGGDGTKLALALLWERRHEVPGAFPVMVVHDEVVVECDEGQADAVAAWVKRAMVDAMAPLIAPVPVEVEVTIGKTWAGAG